MVLDGKVSLNPPSSIPNSLKAFLWASAKAKEQGAYPWSWPEHEDSAAETRVVQS